jgi:hypothetical protein
MVELRVRFKVGRCCLGCIEPRDGRPLISSVLSIVNPSTGNMLAYFRWKSQRFTRPVDFGEVGLDFRLCWVPVHDDDDSIELLHKIVKQSQL